MSASSGATRFEPLLGPLVLNPWHFFNAGIYSSCFCVWLVLINAGCEGMGGGWLQGLSGGLAGEGLAAGLGVQGLGR